MFKWKYLGLLIFIPLFIVPVSKNFNDVKVSTILHDMIFIENLEGYFLAVHQPGKSVPPFPIPIPIVLPQPML
jgi:hypothetical protein